VVILPVCRYPRALRSLENCNRAAEEEKKLCRYLLNHYHDVHSSCPLPAALSVAASAALPQLADAISAMPVGTLFRHIGYPSYPLLCVLFYLCLSCFVFVLICTLRVFLAQFLFIPLTMFLFGDVQCQSTELSQIWVWHLPEAWSKAAAWAASPAPGLQAVCGFGERCC